MKGLEEAIAVIETSVGKKLPTEPHNRYPSAKKQGKTCPKVDVLKFRAATLDIIYYCEGSYAKPKNKCPPNCLRPGVAQSPPMKTRESRSNPGGRRAGLAGYRGSIALFMSELLQRQGPQSVAASSTNLTES